MKNTAAKVFRFYRDGFRSMPDWGRKVWLVIIIKLFLMFAVLKLFFFPDMLKKDFDTDRERGDHVLKELLIKTDTDD
ncbi:MAG: DUF4492 domain-containing protein [Bacteroidales bacterium]|nr:DUF4492 domain-containing protein [Bacteroidales bacterium]